MTTTAREAHQHLLEGKKYTNGNTKVLVHKHGDVHVDAITLHNNLIVQQHFPHTLPSYPFRIASFAGYPTRTTWDRLRPFMYFKLTKIARTGREYAPSVFDTPFPSKAWLCVRQGPYLGGVLQPTHAPPEPGIPPPLDPFTKTPVVHQLSAPYLAFIEEVSSLYEASLFAAERKWVQEQLAGAYKAMLAPRDNALDLQVHRLWLTPERRYEIITGVLAARARRGRRVA